MAPKPRITPNRWGVPSSVSATDGLGARAPALTGFTSITDGAAASAGNFYVIENTAFLFNIIENTAFLFNPNPTGSIWRVSGGGPRERISDGLKQPTSLALGPDGLIFVRQRADGLQGELVESRPVPAPLPLFGAAVAWRQARLLRRRVRATRLGSSGSA